MKQPITREQAVKIAAEDGDADVIRLIHNGILRVDGEGILEDAINRIVAWAMEVRQSAQLLAFCEDGRARVRWKAGAAEPTFYADPPEE